MKTLGLIGGTSWHSTVEYYRDINQAVNEHFGDNTNPPLLLFNLNQSLIHRYQIEGNWGAISDMIIDAGKRLQLAGAEALMCCANTPHKVFNTVSATLEIPMLHIADATAQAIKRQGINKVCFIGTKFTMEADFITSRIGQSGIEVLVPEAPEVIEELHRIIQKELTFGQIEESSKQYVLDTINRMVSQGAEGVILGCTEFPLMISESNLNVPIFNTTHIHSQAAVDFILGRG
ncbi:aspartate/glutamate racemase family protein [Roseivirga sp.]|uniref:aspartate/glutamate racemase family protein n=1 Tax=Roseivirga sp. TaxID=1964215 RepID=UPI002B270351|nr:amino acid racemase [Roseivirga sp.]